jgi:hypothetical protein
MLEHHLKDAYYLAMNPSTKTSFDPGGQNVIVEDVRTGLTVETIKRALAENLFYAQGKFPASPRRMISTWRWPIRCAIDNCIAFKNAKKPSLFDSVFTLYRAYRKTSPFLTEPSAHNNITL